MITKATPKVFSLVDDRADFVVPDPANLPPTPGFLAGQSLHAWYFARYAGRMAQFNHGTGKWLLWGEHTWYPDTDDSIKRLWNAVLTKRYLRASHLADASEGERLRKEIHGAAMSGAALRASLDLAAADSLITSTNDEWDADLNLLGCTNGVVDLRTGKLRDGRPEDMISRSTGVAYDARATAPRWRRFLREVFAGDAELIAWYQLLIGASLTGRPLEMLPIHVGSGSNGKSVARDVLRKITGDYFAVVPIETLMNSRRSAGGATPDLLKLQGARLAFMTESKQRDVLDTSALKILASIDEISGRQLYQEQTTWKPTHTLHLATNHLPAVNETDEGTWRRIAPVPWAVTFKGKDADKDLETTLAGELPAILVWAVAGAVRFLKDLEILPLPKAVEARKTEYRDREDKLKDFIADCLIVGEGSVMAKDLAARYVTWCDANNVPRTSERLSPKQLGESIRERDIATPFRSDHGKTRGYRGISLNVNWPRVTRKRAFAETPHEESI
jgi:putative DNA primase/helicase